MALRNSLLSWLRLLLRLAGLTGFIALLVGLFLLMTSSDKAGALIGGEYGKELGKLIILAGGGACAIALVFELSGAFRFFFSGRGAMGGNVFFQVALAAALLIGVNIYCFEHYARYDWTEKQTFTLPEKWRAELGRLKAETDVVVLLRHAGASGESAPDDYDAAAERKIIEKVKDLAEQFQELGPRFHVQVLDIQKKDYADRLTEIRKEAPELAQAIEKSPDNNILFRSRGTPGVQRLGFNDILQLDRPASIADNNGRGNLVLVSQGVEPFARKALNIEEKKPRIAVAVVHEWLGVEGIKDYGLPGLKKTLAGRGYDYQDIILKAFRPRQEPEATVRTHDEDAYERLDALVRSLDAVIKESEEDKETLDKREKSWREKSLADLNKVYGIVDSNFGLLIMERSELESLRKQGRPVPPAEDLTEEDRQHHLESITDRTSRLARRMANDRKRRDEATKKKSQLNVDNLEEQRRIGDLRAKFTRLLAGADLLILPRVTLINLLLGPRGHALENDFHFLDPAHVEAIKDFMKSGKPVLFCLGPINDPEDPSPTRDEMEKMLTALGFELPNQTILFDIEGEAMAERFGGRGPSEAAPVDVPPAEFDLVLEEEQARSKNPERTASADNSTSKATDKATGKAIRTSLKLTSQSFSKETPALLRVRHPRPVYFLTVHIPREVAAGAVAMLPSPLGLGSVQGAGLLVARSTRKFDDKAMFLATSPNSWNEDQPFRTPKRTPHFEPPKSDDPDKGSVKEKRRGPFPIGVAIETTLPAGWFSDDAKVKAPAKVRVAVLGSVGAFTSETLTPMQEKLFFDMANWLMSRDHLLSHKDADPWKYPRVDLDDDTARLWSWGAILAVPLIFVYLGLMIWLVRARR